MASEYSVAKCFDHTQGQQWVVVYQHSPYLEVNNLEVESFQDVEELNFYSSVAKNENKRQTSKVFMIIPVKQIVPLSEPCMSFDFEINILDFRQLK